MKLARFTHAGATRLGLVEGEEVVDLPASAPDLPADTLALLEWSLDELPRAAAGSRHRVPLAEVRLEAPIPRPPKFLAVGLNYLDHIEETGRKAPEVPVIFNKQSTCIAGPYDDVHLPKVSRMLDYEGELGFVIGRRCRHVPRGKAYRVIAGYLVVNDLSVRDWQMRAPTMTLGKSFDTHGPTGPWIASIEEVGDPHALSIRTWVNGELRQSSNTRNLLFDCYALVEHLSTAFTLEPGDIVSTGTSAGVGVASDPPRWLVPGDVVRVEVENIGAIENRVIEEP